MSLTADQAKTQIDILINTNIIQSLNNFIALPNDTHRYRYYPNKELSKILFKFFSSYYIKDMSKRLNKKPTITKPLTSTEADLKFALDSGDAQTDKVTCGSQKGLRDVVTIDGKHFSYNPNKITKALANRLTKLLKHNRNMNWQMTFDKYMLNID